MIFVFGSNLAGIHGAGAARYALLYEGAVMGVGIGHQGNSYALPTKDGMLTSLSLQDVQYHVDAFIGYALRNMDKQFKVTQIGCGLAGFKPHEIAPLFRFAPKNCYFDLEWKPWLGNIHPGNLDDRRYWGHQ